MQHLDKNAIYVHKILSRSDCRIIGRLRISDYFCNLRNVVHDRQSQSCWFKKLFSASLTTVTWFQLFSILLRWSGEWTDVQRYRNWGSHSGGYEKSYFLEYNGMCSVHIQQVMFRRHIWPPLLGLNNKPSKKLAWSRYLLTYGAEPFLRSQCLTAWAMPRPYIRLGLPLW
jgi:hypothetical protein